MFEYFKGKLTWLLDQLLAPFWNWLSKASWKVKAAVFLAGLAAVTGAARPEVVVENAKRAACFYRVLAAGGASVPLEARTVHALKELQSRLALSVDNDISTVRNGIMTAWSTSQAVLALSSAGAMRSDSSAKLLTFIRENKEPACGCWHEVALPTDPMCVFESGWILASMAEMNVPAAPDEVTFILKSQSSDGWWPMFPVNSEESEFASTYATAWSILGLKAQLDKGLLPADARIDAESAVRRGAAWLLSVRRDRSRWEAYPYRKEAKISEAISGIVIHSLHHTIPEQTAGIEKDWLANLPSSAIGIDSTDPVYVEVRRDGKLVGIDQFVQIRLPWVLMATLDAYPSGDNLSRSKALYWLDRVLSQKSVASADAGLANWWRAEFLFSLGHVLKNT